MDRHLPLKRRLLRALAASPFFAHASAWSQTLAPQWPTQTVRLMVGFPGGSTPDTMARTIADGLSKVWGQTVVVDNRPGASGNIAANQVARANDEHTLGVLINGNLTVARLINPATPFDPSRDFSPISLLGTAPLVLAVSPHAPGRTPAELMRWSRTLGRRGNYGTPGKGTVSHLGMELLKSKTDIVATHVPFGGNPQVATALMRGDVHLSLLPPGIAMPLVKTGKLKAIAVTSPMRSPLAPGLPTLREAGISGTDLEVWTALVGPAHLSQAVVTSAALAVAAVMRQPEMQARLLAAGWQGMGSSPGVLTQRMASDTSLLADIVVSRRIQVDE